MNSRLIIVVVCASSAILVALLVPAAASRAAEDRLDEDPGYMFGRPVVVEEEGWVLVPLGPDTRRTMASERDLRIVGPDNGDVPYWIVDTDSSALISGTIESEPVQAHLTSVALTESPGSATWLLEPLGPGTEMLTVSLECASSASTAVRLAEANEGSWGVLAEAVAEPNEEGAAFVEVPLDAGIQREALLLDLVSQSKEPPELVSAAAVVAPAWLLFQAEEAATFRLEYSSVASARQAPEWKQEPIELDDIRVVEPGRQTRLLLEPLPELAVRPGAELDPSEYEERWKLVATGLDNGELADLTLPPAVFGVGEPTCSGCVPRDVRLEHGGRQVPYIAVHRNEPALMLSEPDTAPTVSDVAGKSAITISLPGEHLPMTQMELSAPTAPFSRRVLVHYLMPPSRPGVQSRERNATVFDGVWECQENPMVNCRLAIPMGSNPTRDLEIVFDDGDNAPLPSVSLRIWHMAEALKFAWPGSPVSLLVGHSDPEAPIYDLQVLEDDVRRRPAAAITAVPVPPVQLDDEKSRLLLIGALLVAGAALLIILSKTLRD